MQIPEYLQIRFSDNMVYQISVSFIYSHYQKNPTVKNQKLSKEQFIANSQTMLEYAVKNISWGECSLSAIAIQNEIPVDYEKEFKQPDNKKIIYCEAPVVIPSVVAKLETDISKQKIMPVIKTVKVKKKKRMSKTEK